MECLSCGLEFEVEHEYSYERDSVEVLYCPFCGSEIESDELDLNLIEDYE